MRGMLEANRHHNVPRSRGGSSAKCNISVVHSGRHDEFHTWAWNYPPDTVLRLMAIHAVRVPGQSFPPNAMEDYLSALTDVPWERFYEPNAVNGGKTKKHQERAAYFREQHVLDEEDDTHRIIGELVLREEFPPDRHAFFQRAALFFGAASPREAIERFLTEVFRGQELVWTKALRSHVRAEVQAILLAAHPVTLSSADEQRIVDILQDHKARLHQWYS